MEQICQIIGIVAEPAYNFVRKHINYVACVSRLIKKLKEKCDKLNDKKDEIALRVERASGEGKVIIPEVNKWLEQVSTCIENVNQFLDEEKRISDDNKSGFHQCCCFVPNNHKTGKEAEALTTALNELLEEAKEQCFFDVGVLPPPPPPPEMALHPAAYSKAFDSRESLLKTVIEALKVNDMIGIYGMAGVGKTMLVSRLVAEVKSQNLFDKVGIATVSKNPSYTVIQNVLVDRILGHDKELHAKSEGKKDWLHEELEKLKQQQKKVLLVLDDAWNRLVLHEVGIPHPNKDFKIVVTSRFRLVCAQMEAKGIFEVRVLGEQEAWILFRQSLGDYSKVLDSGEGFKEVAEEMVKRFKGLPLAIVTLAGALIDDSLPTWRAAAKYLNERQLSKIEGMSEKVIGAIEFSFNYLRNEDDRYIFLLCCLFPEDWNIELNVLMRYGIGLGWFEDVGLSHTMDRIVDITGKLKSRSLLLKGDKDVEVKMHDVTRDVALHIASKGEYGYLVKEDKDGRMGNVPRNMDKLSAISILSKTNPIEIFGRDKKEYPNLHILRLQCNLERGYSRMPIEFPTCFFERIGNLKILEIRNMSIDSFPTGSLGSSKKNLRTLCLYNCLVIDIAEIGELTNLEILDLRHSSIRGGLYGAVQRLSGLRVLDLTYCRVNGLADNFVGGLPTDQLEGLHLRNVRITDNSNKMTTSLVELEVLTRLEMLDVQVESLEQLTDKFLSIFGKLSSFHLTLWGKFEDYPHYDPMVFGPSDKILRLHYITTKKDLPRGLGHLFGAANKLVLFHCGVPIMSLESYKGEFSNLTSLSIYYCDAAEDFVISGRRTVIKSAAESIHDDGLTHPFAKLEYLQIWSVARLRAVCAPNQHIVLSKLKTLYINRCPLLRYLFTKSVAIQLQQLKTINILRCDEMKEIIFTGSGDNNYKTSTTGISSSEEIMDDTNSIILPSLQEIILQYLPHLKHFTARNTSPPPGADRSTLFGEQVKFPELKGLQLMGLASCENIWESHLLTGSFGQLRKLFIMDCHELRYIFSAAVARGLEQLQELEIQWCAKLEQVVVVMESDNEEENNITFPSLRQLSLYHLKSLHSFCSAQNSILKFPCLEEIEIKYNSNMQVFSYGSLHTPKLTGRAPLYGDEDLNIFVARKYQESKDLQTSSSNAELSVHDKQP